MIQESFFSARTILRIAVTIPLTSCPIFFLRRFIMKRRIVSLLLITVLILGCFTTVSFGASKKKKMTVYYQVCKVGDVAYCSSEHGLFKADLKNGKSITVYDEVICEAGGMKEYKGYLYFIDYGDISGDLYRVKISNNKVQRLASVVNEYAISKKKIYYVGYANIEGSKVKKRVMKLNGKGKKKSSYKVANKYKASNVKGYYIQSKMISKVWKTYVDDLDGETKGYWEYKYTDYLVTPDKQIPLCTYDSDEVL